MSKSIRYEKYEREFLNNTSRYTSKQDKGFCIYNHMIRNSNETGDLKCSIYRLHKYYLIKKGSKEISFTHFKNIVRSLLPLLKRRFEGQNITSDMVTVSPTVSLTVSQKSSGSDMSQSLDMTKVEGGSEVVENNPNNNNNIYTNTITNNRDVEIIENLTKGKKRIISKNNLMQLAKLILKNNNALIPEIVDVVMTKINNIKTKVENIGAFKYINKLVQEKISQYVVLIEKRKLESFELVDSVSHFICEDTSIFDTVDCNENIIFQGF